jgi:hypothetical protein
MRPWHLRRDEITVYLSDHEINTVIVQFGVYSDSFFRTGINFRPSHQPRTKVIASPISASSMYSPISLEQPFLVNSLAVNQESRVLGRWISQVAELEPGAALAYPGLEDAPAR